MTRSNYAAGAEFERAVVRDLTKHGYVGTRTPGSKGPRKVDVFAVKTGEILFLQCKYNTGTVGPAERALLIAVARSVNAIPLAATRKKYKHIVYRRLTGAGDGEWEPWTPDTLGGA